MIHAGKASSRTGTGNSLLGDYCHRCYTDFAHPWQGLQPLDGWIMLAVYLVYLGVMLFWVLNVF